MAANTNFFTTEEQSKVSGLETAGGGWTQKQIPLGDYPNISAETSESGHTFITDDTPGSEQISTIHRTGTFTTMHPDGSMTHNIVGTGYEIVAKDKKISIKGDCQVTIYGNCNMEIKGDKIERVLGDYYQEVQGDFNQLVYGDTSITSKGDIDISAGSALGVIRMLAPNRLSVMGDITTDGALKAESIMSRNEVTAGTGIHAGLPGSLNPIAGISTLGGIAAGSSQALGPGIMSASLLAMAPVVMDALGTMQQIRLLYDLHIHPAPRGMTGLPIPLM